MDRLSSVIEPIKRLFAIDLRSLACLRIGVGLLILIDLLLRSRDLVAFYTDQGLLPRSLLTTSPNALTHWSLHLVNGAPWFQALVVLCRGVSPPGCWLPAIERPGPRRFLGCCWHRFTCGIR